MYFLCSDKCPDEGDNANEPMDASSNSGEADLPTSPEQDVNIHVVEEEIHGTHVLELWYKIGENEQDFVVCHDNQRNLVVKNSPLGVEVQDGDVIASWDHVDVRNMDYKTFKENHLANDKKKKKRIRVIIYKKGFDPADLNPDVPVRLSSL